MSLTSAEGSQPIGRFISDGESWQYEDFRSDLNSTGKTDSLETLESFLYDLKSISVEAGAIGYISYDWGCRSLGLNARCVEEDSWLIPHMQFLVFERLTHPPVALVTSATTIPRAFTRRDLDAIVQNDAIRPCVSKSRYLADVRQIKDHIAAGDIYQANYTQAFELRTDLGSAENVNRLGSRLHAPYGGYMRFGPSSMARPDGSIRSFPAMAIMAASPERFWRLRSGVIDSRPIKGTVARADSASEDRRRKRQLLASGKDRAELLMITDTVRNDLGQVADIGSVKTDALVRIRPTPSVWHLESTVSARLAPTLSWVNVMKALFPAASISGTPKRRAVEILEILEPVRRGPYCGAVGWVDVKGDADFAVGIRTCVQIGNTIRIHGGGGIVADSNPEAEYYESLVKIAPIIECLFPARSSTNAPEAQTAQGANA